MAFMDRSENTSMVTRRVLGEKLVAFRASDGRVDYRVRQVSVRLPRDIEKWWEQTESKVRAVPETFAASD
jgi:hypothetical protein